MAKSDRTPSGKKKKKNWGATKNHLNEFHHFEYVDYSVFDKARETDKRAQFKVFVKPLIERKKSFSRLNAKLEIITGRNKQKAIQEASIIPQTPGDYAATSAFMQSTWSDIKKRVYINQNNVIVFSQSEQWKQGESVTTDDVKKIQAQGILPVLVNQKEKPEYKITRQE